MTQQLAARRHRQVLDWPVVAGGDEIVGETPRLRLRRLRPSDIDAVAAMVADREQMRFYPRPRSRAEVAAWRDWNHWNRGLATEAAFASLQLGFKRFGLSRLVAIIHPDNHASRRVARKLGMAEERSLVREGEPTVVYGISA